MSYLGTFEPKFEKTIVIFEISTFEFVKMQSFTLNRKKPKRNKHKNKTKKTTKKQKKKKNKIWDQNCLIGCWFWIGI